MAFFADDVERLREVARKYRALAQATVPLIQVERDAEFIEGIADKILNDLAEPTQFPWPATPPQEES